MAKNIHDILICIWLVTINSKIDVSRANIALFKRVIMSSTYINSSPQSLVDGKIDQYWSGSNCACTNDGPGAPSWIAIDLEKAYYITKVVAYGRADCCGDRLNNVKVGTIASFNSSYPINDQKITTCGSFPSNVQNGAVIEIQCHYVGQFVIFVQGAFSVGWMTICEAEVFNNPDWASINVALQKQVYMSSEHVDGSKTSINDGIPSDFFKDHNCAITNGGPGTKNWIAIDLAFFFHIIKVVAYNERKCYGYRVNNVNVGSITSFDMGQAFLPKNITICGKFPANNPNNARIEISCNIIARYLIFEQPILSPGYLTICEAEVYIALV